MKKILFFVAFLLLAIAGESQIYCPNLHKSKWIAGKDSVYIINLPYAFSGVNIDTLRAVSPYGSPCVFEWFKFSYQDTAFHKIPFLPTDSVLYSSLQVDTSGGYMVRIHKANKPDITFKAWLFMNEVTQAQILNKRGDSIYLDYACDYLQLKALIKHKTFHYFTSDSDSIGLKLNNNIIAKFIADPGGSNYTAYPLNSTSETYKTIIWNPDAVDTRFTLKVTDPFGVAAADTVLYKSIQVNAKLQLIVKGSKSQKTDASDTTTITSTVFEGLTPDPQSLEGSGPVSVKFINYTATPSKGSETYWFYFEDTVHASNHIKVADSISHDTIDAPTHKYYFPGSYQAIMIAQNIWGCRDTVRTPVIKVLDAELEFPNVFTLTSLDQMKPALRNHFLTIQSFHISIFSRWGRTIYEYSGDINEWEGWDGNIHGSPASPGLYFYVVESGGYGDIKPIDGGKRQFKGFFYFYR
jgi:hypothetical protein